MEENTNKNRNKKYDRVMPRVFNRSRSSVKSGSLVIRHNTPSSVRLGGKPSVSNLNSSVFSDLPTVLNDYDPVVDRVNPVKRTSVVKPRRTVKSLDPALSPPRTVVHPRDTVKKSRNLRAEASLPSVLMRERDKLFNSHLKQCYSSRSHSKLNELKEEIQSYHDTEKLMRLRSHLYRSCGVVLEDEGRPAVDKAVQVEDAEQAEKERDAIKRSQQRPERVDAGASVPDEQVRTSPLRYPVDRYLVESSNKFEIVNIIDDEIWNPEPALRPEDEIILRKLHDMLQSTADDLKLLSGELSKYHEPGVQVITAPTPLDEEFNERVHIEEVVNAKFHGYKIIDKHIPTIKPRNDEVNMKTDNQKSKIINTATQMNTTITKRPVRNRNLGISRTRIIQIDDKNQDSGKEQRLNNGKVIKEVPKIVYNEFAYKYIEPEVEVTLQKKLQVQDMPRINIRSELKRQKVLQLDIVPDNYEVRELNTAKSNVSVVVMRHERLPQDVPPSELHPQISSYKVTRKISQMSAYESSGSVNNISSDAQVKLNTQKRIITSIRSSPKNTARNRNKKNVSSKGETKKRSGINLDEWKKKLNVVYGSASHKKKSSPPKVTSRKLASHIASASKVLNNAEYIPYSQLTLGGVTVSDIEREISDLPNKKDIPLSPILDKILSSRENSFHKGSPRKQRLKSSPKILTTSDENLLQEVINIEKSVSETLSKNLKTKLNEPLLNSPKNSGKSSNEKENDESYADDFEDDKSDQSSKSGNPVESDGNSSVQNLPKSNDSNTEDAASDAHHSDNRLKPSPSLQTKDTTYTKSTNLSFKDSVDIFEFIHSVDMQDTATQSSTLNKITPKETQTSPRNEKSNIQPIHNDLWPSIDPRREVEKMFQMEKDFIKKLIIDEYGDLLEKNIQKPSTSNGNNEEDTRKNISASQKNTQTSPAHVKSVMTSPSQTKTRTTSPFHLSVPVHQQTSPMLLVTNEEQIIDVANEAEDISVNLSSPRFSLRLPQTSREVLCNLGAYSRTSSKNNVNIRKSDNRTFRKTSVSSSSLDGDNSSSELSSLGEVKTKKLRKRIPSNSEFSSSSAFSKYSSDFQSIGILPLRSEGEVSLGQVSKMKKGHSDGETTFDRFTFQ